MLDYTAYDLGYKAAEADGEITANPYNHETENELSEAWFDGYCAHAEINDTWEIKLGAV
jgi:hypothetical protein